MKWENIEIGNKIFEKVMDFRHIQIVDEIIQLDEKDALESLAHLNSLFMNAIVNPEVVFSNKNYSTICILEENVKNHNKQLLHITSQLRDFPKSYWRDTKLNSILTNGI